MTTWLLADTHWYHRAIIGYCGRPEDHNERMWQAVEDLVQPDDTLIHLGDVAFVKPSCRDRIVERLPGRRKILIEGNHDRRGKMRSAKGWHAVCRAQYQPLMTGEAGVVCLLSHRPMEPPCGFQGIMIHGHVHEKGTPYRWVGDVLVACVCVEIRNYEPVALSEVVAEYRKRFPETTYNNLSEGPCVPESLEVYLGRSKGDSNGQDSGEGDQQGVREGCGRALPGTGEAHG